FATKARQCEHQRAGRSTECCISAKLARLSKPEHRGRRGENATALFVVSGAAACEYALQAYESLRHCPIVVESKHRLEEKRQSAQQRFVGTDFPVVNDVHEWPVRGEGPDAAALKIARCLQRKVLRKALFDRARGPVQQVGQPALGDEPVLSSDARVIAF